MPVAGPFYFAWVDPDEATFGTEHHRMDEYIFSIRRTLSEGQKPTLDLEIKNPHVGLLNPSRKYWAWLAWDNGTTIVPLFFGRLVGTPLDIFAEVMHIQLIADPVDYKHQIQRMAETLKVLPYYDPIWIEVGKRDDPDKILETRAAFWDVDPVTHIVDMVGITEGPDGNVDLDEDDHFYDGMNMTIGQPPAIAILMDATVPWTQTGRGVLDAGTHTIKSYSNSLMSEWPKPLTQLGQGWSVFTSSVFDANKTDMAQSVTVSYNWQNKEKHHNNGDTMSVSQSITVPMGGVAGESAIITEVSQSGVLDPFAVDEEGDPSPLNIPLSYNNTSTTAMVFQMKTTLVFEYRAERPRTERVVFLIKADMQPTLVDPDIDQESETMTLTASDVGVPILNLLNWTTVSGTAVSIGQVIFPDDPQLPGGRTAQIAIQAGTAGLVPPNFSDIPGEETTDGTVIWSSLGSATPPDNSADWTFGTHYEAGSIILPRRPFYVPYNVLVAGGLAQFPPKSTGITEGTIVQKTDGNFYICTLSGETGGPVESAVFFNLGPVLPTGSTYFIAINDGTSGAQYHIPAFGSHTTLHSRFTEGTVTWQSIGSGDIPIGGVPGDIRSPSFFTLDRGLRSLEYLALLVRAKLLWRGRCVDITFDVDWPTGYTITTRKTITLHDPRIAGGIVVGKVKSAVLSFSGTAICTVTISCTVGKDQAYEEVEGDPTYMDADYADDYQEYDGTVILLPTGSDLTYDRPTYRVTDDGLTFPLTRSAIAVDQVHGTLSAQAGAVRKALASMKEAANPSFPFFGTVGFGQDPFSTQYAIDLQRRLLSANSVQAATEANPIWIEYQLKPMNAVFHAVYHVKFSDLSLPRGIDLESETTT